MNNYIVINDHRIELTEEQVKQIVAAQGQQDSSVQLSGIAVGDKFKIGEHEFIVLEHSGDTTAVIRKELLPDMQFGNSNNYDGSHVDEKCQEFAQEVAEIISWDNIVLHTVDLTSNDGLKDYGTVERRASLLTADRYRRYVEVLDNFKPDDWWWLATPFSTKKHDSDSFVLCVAPSGYVGDFLCNRGIGVRPFLILKSNIFVSK